jgi:hypothetical protein
MPVAALKNDDDENAPPNSMTKEEQKFQTASKEELARRLRDRIRNVSTRKVGFKIPLKETKLKGIKRAVQPSRRNSGVESDDHVLKFRRVLPSGTHQLADSKDEDHDDDDTKKDEDEDAKNEESKDQDGDEDGAEDGAQDGFDVKNDHAAIDIFCDTSSAKVKSPRLSEDSELSHKCYQSQQQVLNLDELDLSCAFAFE